MVKLEEREVAEMQRLTRVVGTGFAIGWSKDNWDRWERALDTDGTPVTPADKVSGYRSMLGFLSANFPGSVKVVQRDN